MFHSTKKTVQTPSASRQIDNQIKLHLATFAVNLFKIHSIIILLWNSGKLAQVQLESDRNMVVLVSSSPHYTLGIKTVSILWHTYRMWSYVFLAFTYWPLRGHLAVASQYSKYQIVLFSLAMHSHCSEPPQGASSALNQYRWWIITSESLVDRNIDWDYSHFYIQDSKWVLNR